MLLSVGVESSHWYKQVPTHYLLLCAIETGDLLDSSQADIRNPLRYLLITECCFAAYQEWLAPLPWYKQAPTNCLLLRTIEAGDLLDSVKMYIYARAYSGWNAELICCHRLQWQKSSYLAIIPEHMLCVLHFSSNFIDPSIVFDIYSHLFVKRAFAICFATRSLTK